MENNNYLSLNNDLIRATSYRSKKPEIRRNFDTRVGSRLNAYPTDSPSQTDKNPESNFNGFNHSCKIEPLQVGSNSNGSFRKGVYSKAGYDFNSFNGVYSNDASNSKGNFIRKFIDQEEGSFDQQQQQFYGENVKENKKNNYKESGNKIGEEDKNEVEKRFRTLSAAESLRRSETVGKYIFVCNNDENLERQYFDNLYTAAIAGDPDAITELGTIADRQNEEGETILHTESKNGNTERVGFILREFPSKNLLVKLNIYKHTALHLAACYGRTEVVEILIDAARHLPSSSADDNTNNPVSSFEAFLRQGDDFSNTALHAAIDYGNGFVSIVKLLVEADPNDRHNPNSRGKTPIYMAAERGYNNIVKVICTTCTAPSLGGPDGDTALHAFIANIQKAKEEDREIISVIINAAKRWSTMEGTPNESIEAFYNRTEESGQTVLDLAVERNYFDAVELILLEDPAYRHGSKKNGLMRLIYKVVADEECKDILKLLCDTYEAGIDSCHKGVIELILAIQRRDKESVASLLRVSKHLVTFADDEGWTPLHYAAYHEFVSVLDVIIEAQKDVGHQFMYGDMVSTPLHVAAGYGYTFTVIRLMQLWPALSSTYTAVNKNGQNILHLAAAQNRKEMVQGILKYCPEKYKGKILKQQDANGDTPLHLLISNGCFIPELIKHKGLDTLAKNKKHWTPRDMLYFKDDIIADQVQIKIALDDVQINQSAWIFWGKNMEKKTDILESIVLPSKREIKDVIFNQRKCLLMDEKHGRMKKDLERYRKRTNTQIIVTALITTVTFTVGFTMPGGLHQSGEVDEGLVVLSKKTAFDAFMVSDALALLMSTTSLFFYFLESMNEDPNQVSKLNAASTLLNIVSVMAMMLTFIAGTYVVLYHSPALAITVCVIGSLFFLIIIVLLMKIVYDRHVKRNQN